MKSLFDSPTVEYCEKAIEGLISRPGYAVSNLPFIILGIILILRAKNNKLAKLFGVSAIIIGLCSFYYDASFTYLSQYIDWLGMFIFILILSLLNVKRIINISNAKLYFYAFLIIIFYLLLSFITQQGTLFFGIGVIFVIFSEMYLLYKEQRKVDIKWLVALLLFLVGFIARNLDLYGIICDPSNIINGRGILHYLSTLSIFLLYLYYTNIKYKSE